MTITAVLGLVAGVRRVATPGRTRARGGRRPGRRSPSAPCSPTWSVIWSAVVARPGRWARSSHRLPLAGARLRARVRRGRVGGDRVRALRGVHQSRRPGSRLRGSVGSAVDLQQPGRDRDAAGAARAARSRAVVTERRTQPLARGRRLEQALALAVGQSHPPRDLVRQRHRVVGEVTSGSSRPASRPARRGSASTARARLGQRLETAPSSSGSQSTRACR